MPPKKNRDPNKPKGRMSPYAFFVQERRAQYRQKGQEVKFTEFSKVREIRRRRPRALQERDGPIQATCRPRLKEEEGPEHAKESRVSSHIGLLRGEWVGGRRVA